MENTNKNNLPLSGPATVFPGNYGPGPYAPGVHGPGAIGPGTFITGVDGVVPGSFQVGITECWTFSACCLAFCVPCGALCLHTVAVDKALKTGYMGPFCLGLWCSYFGLAHNRTKIREKYGIRGTKCQDFYHLCAYGSTWMAMQEYHDAKIREEVRHHHP